MAWTETQLEMLDAMLRTAVREILRKSPSYTSTVLQHPDLDKIPSVADSINKAKLQML